MAHALSSSARLPDSELAALTLAGDNEAFAEIVHRYQDRLFNTIVRIVGCPCEAEDVLQDAMLLAFRNLGRFRGDSALYTWLYRLAVNQALTHRRRKKHTLSLDSDTVRWSPEPLDPGNRPEDRLERTEDRERIQRLLARLKEEYRVVLVLRELEQLDYAEIASILGINVGTVRSRLHRARMALRELLAA